MSNNIIIVSIHEWGQYYSCKKVAFHTLEVASEYLKEEIALWLDLYWNRDDPFRPSLQVFNVWNLTNKLVRTRVWNKATPIFHIDDQLQNPMIEVLIDEIPILS